ncbi:hypothetical protein ACMYSQ_000004 [Aspergillus niger]
MNGYTGGLGHPFLHLAYAYEFRSKEVATQALSQGCTEYNALHTLLDQAPPDSSKYETGSLAVVFESVRQGPRLGGLFNEPGINNINLLSQEQNLALVLEHWICLGKVRDWKWVIDTALAHKWALDAHFFKVVRTPKVSSKTFGRRNDFYLKAAIKFVTEFYGWEGYDQGAA